MRTSRREVTNDFIYLNVPALLDHYANPSQLWREKVNALASTEISFFVKEGLIRETARALIGSVQDAVIRFSDFTEEGQDFVKSQAVERWLGACDRKGTVEAYRDPSGLERRLEKFRKARNYGARN